MRAPKTLVALAAITLIACGPGHNFPYRETPTAHPPPPEDLLLFSAPAPTVGIDLLGAMALPATEEPVPATPEPTPTPEPTASPTAAPPPPTAPPAPVAPVAAAAAPRGSGMEATVWELAQAFAPANPLGAVRVAWCESGFDAGATGGAGERGLWQIHPVHADSTYDPWGNGAAMGRISGGGTSFAAWAGGLGDYWAAGGDCPGKAGYG